MNASLPPLCMSALGALLLLVAAGVLPWAETILILGVVAIAHALPLGHGRLNSAGLALARKRSVAPPGR